MRLFILLLSLVYTSLLFGESYKFNRGEHTFTFESDTSIYITPISENSNFAGLGYYLNSGDTFYSISEEEITKALNFKAGDEVMFVKKHNNNAYLKTNLWKNDIYTIGGNGNGNIKFKIVAAKMPSGQPLPPAYFSVIAGIILLYWVKRKLV